MVGNTYYALELGKCGEKRATGGALDIEMEFSPNVGQEICAVLFFERSDTAQFHYNAAY
jgi:hypothetical protein